MRNPLLRDNVGGPFPKGETCIRRGGAEAFRLSGRNKVHGAAGPKHCSAAASANVRIGVIYGGAQ
jgi:hypothetical protein